MKNWKYIFDKLNISYKIIDNINIYNNNYKSLLKYTFIIINSTFFKKIMKIYIKYIGIELYLIILKILKII